MGSLAQTALGLLARHRGHGDLHKAFHGHSHRHSGSSFPPRPVATLLIHVRIAVLATATTAFTTEDTNTTPSTAMEMMGVWGCGHQAGPGHSYSLGLCPGATVLSARLHFSSSSLHTRLPSSPALLSAPDPTWVCLGWAPCRCLPAPQPCCLETSLPPPSGAPWGALFCLWGHGCLVEPSPPWWRRNS